ncbi:hypothetical protein V12B01_13590 [Vibrio splendidus 12B01]|nr:hypothetical protein V12B01_13590 [Vibrio splendidus 12B01]
MFRIASRCIVIDSLFSNCIYCGQLMWVL